MDLQALAIRVKVSMDEFFFMFVTSGAGIALRFASDVIVVMKRSA